MTDASQLKPDRWLCTGCDRCAADPEADLAEMRAGGAISCCPERKLIGLYRRPNPSGDADVREKVKALLITESQAGFGCVDGHEWEWCEKDFVAVSEALTDAILALTGNASTVVEALYDAERIPDQHLRATANLTVMIRRGGLEAEVIENLLSALNKDGGAG